MRVSQAEMDKGHARIVEGAARLFRERGIEKTSVSDVMAEAGFTQGGFYRHFKNKDAIVIAALQTAFDHIASSIEGKTESTEPPAAVEAFRGRYLSKQHLDSPGKGCPIAALGCDVARGSDGLRIAFGAGVSRITAALARGKHGSAQERRIKATQELAMMAGAIMIARACDPETARQVLAACRAVSPEESSGKERA